MSTSPGNQTDAHVAALQRALVPLRENPTQVSPEQREQAERVAARARTQMGTGIDPAVVAACVDDFDQALKIDPGCVAAYQGMSRAALALASARPDHAPDLLAHTLRWLRVSMVRVATLQDDEEMLELEDRLRAARRRARSRPKATGPSVRVQVERDAEGRALRPPTARRARPRFRPDSEELAALLPAPLVAGAEGGPEVPRWAGPTVGLLFLVLGGIAAVYQLQPILVGALLAVGLLLVGLPVLVLIGLQTRGWAPGVIAVALIATTMTATDRFLAKPPAQQKAVLRFSPQVDQLYTELRPQLRLPAGEQRRLLGLQRVALVEETGELLRPLRASPLHPRLSAKLRVQPGQQPAFVVVLRRYQSPAGALLVMWILDREQRKVTNREAFGYEPLPALEQRALAWLESQGQVKPE